jgi:hypothetical protein
LMISTCDGKLLSYRSIHIQYHLHGQKMEDGVKNRFAAGQ